MISPLRWAGDRLVLVDQTRLPVEEVERTCATMSSPRASVRTPPNLPKASKKC